MTYQEDIEENEMCIAEGRKWVCKSTCLSFQLYNILQKTKLGRQQEDHVFPGVGGGEMGKWGTEGFQDRETMMLSWWIHVTGYLYRECTTTSCEP